MKSLIYWELRKTVNILTALLVPALCIVWFFVCKYIFVGSYNDINGEIYKSYISDLSALSAEEQSEYIRAEGDLIRETLSSWDEMQQKYMNGQLSDEEYLDYTRNYNICRARAETFNVISQKAERFRKDHTLRFTYDLELEGYLTTMTADFPLIIMLIIFAGRFFITEIPVYPFILTCRDGGRKTYRAKFLTHFITAFIIIFAFNLAELTALFSKNLGDLYAPAASMDAFAVLDTDITCFSYIVSTYIYRIISEIVFCVLLFAISNRCKKYITFYCVTAALLAIPAFLTDIIPQGFRGAVLYYTLCGNSVTVDKNTLSVLVGMAVWTAVSLVMTNNPRLKKQ